MRIDGTRSVESMREWARTATRPTLVAALEQAEREGDRELADILRMERKERDR